MTECVFNQSNGETLPTAVVETKKLRDCDLVANTTLPVLEPTCLPECASVAELINSTVEQFCMNDRSDSRGTSNVAGGTRDDSHLSPLPDKPLCDAFMDGQVSWQKRGRFIIWPVSLGEDRHVKRT